MQNTLFYPYICKNNLIMPKVNKIRYDARNAKIKAKYEELQDKGKDIDTALYLLSKRFNLSFQRIRDIIYMD